MASLLKSMATGTTTAAQDATTAAKNTTTAVADDTTGVVTDILKKFDDLIISFANDTQEVLHVYTFDHRTRRIKETAIIPFKNVDATKILLSDVRELLLSEKAVEPRLLWSEICNQRGAKVQDTISFQAYLDILNEKSSEVGETTEDNADTYRVYLLSEEIADNSYIRSFLDRGAKATIDKLAQQPVAAAQPKVPEVPTSFSHNIFLNPTTTFSIIHAADMSEKHWSVVIRNNSLLNAHQVIDAGGRVGKIVERSMHTTFRLKPRLFLNYQISASAASDSIAKQKQMLRIPRFRIEDDSYIEQFQTSKSVSRAIAQSSLSETSAEAAVSGGAFGFSASASASYSDEKSSTTASSSSSDTQVMTITYNFPRVVIDFDHHSLELTEECKADLLSIDSAAGINSFKEKYGRFFVTRIELGGRLHASEETTATTETEKAEQARSQKAAAALSFSSPYVQASAKMSHGEASSSNSDKSSSSSSHSMCWEAKGGDTLQCNDPTAWAYTVGSFYNWRPVKQSRVLSLEDVISTIPGHQDTKENWANILKTNTKTEPANTKTEIGFSIETAAQGKSLTVASSDEGGFLGTVFKQAEEVPISDQRAIYLKRLSQATSGGTPLVYGPLGSSASQKFFIEVDNKDGEKATIKYNQPYRIYSKTGDKDSDRKWLGSTPTLEGYVDTSLIWAGSEENATKFQFVYPFMGGNSLDIEDSAPISISMYNQEDEHIGLAMAVPSEGLKSAKAVGVAQNSYRSLRDTLFKFTYV
ncbi:hypothetical protein BO70DRAFT_427471 [Aspergillus heteromorphus CBS 117.55]|uniref:MACPF domain-containing protein n=1 Tax=Aspergillus heteromorphus CBS 117.55 TaxID=1448321 RepID=A0A317WMP9_9EURO|nr:uncharacterized protein BO70DRAFT_427471 [Aspergillus heteromorphus CBS 117.55]PWY87543.1 hypothetical protein BO70DRAFT_427471 [Aspergillus heteromorphus CBS 117.55]